MRYKTSVFCYVPFLLLLSLNCFCWRATKKTMSLFAYRSTLMLTRGKNLITSAFRRLHTSRNWSLYANTICFPSVTPLFLDLTHRHSYLSSHCTLTTTQLFTSLSPNRSSSRSAHRPGQMELKEVLEVMEQLAPLSLAESWDNVGLLVEPSKPRPIRSILLTNDLTDAVMEEAETMGCNLIISYHPPLFRPIKRLVQRDWKQRLAVRAVESGMAIFSPHTSWDSVKGGVNDWLVGGLGKRSLQMETVSVHQHTQYLQV